MMQQLFNLNKCPLCQKNLSAICRGRQAESSDDEEHFRRKEASRLERDRAKLNPVILGTPPPMSVCPLGAHDILFPSSHHLNILVVPASALLGQLEYMKSRMRATDRTQANKGEDVQAGGRRTRAGRVRRERNTRLDGKRWGACLTW